MPLPIIYPIILNTVFRAQDKGNLLATIPLYRTLSICLEILN